MNLDLVFIQRTLLDSFKWFSVLVISCAIHSEAKTTVIMKTSTVLNKMNSIIIMKSILLSSFDLSKNKSVFRTPTHFSPHSTYYLVGFNKIERSRLTQLPQVMCIMSIWRWSLLLMVWVVCKIDHNYKKHYYSGIETRLTGSSIKPESRSNISHIPNNDFYHFYFHLSICNSWTCSS